jgi:hypothetical protein
MAAKKKPDKNLDYKVNLIFDYTRDMHQQLYSILLLLGIVFALVLFNTYTLYDAHITGEAVLGVELSLYSPFGLAIIFLVLAVLFIGLGTFRKGKFEKIIRRL